MGQVIPEAAVEAAAIRWFATAHAELSWASLPVIEQERLKLCARAALEAAAPFMLAGLRELVEDMEQQPSSELATVPGLAVLIRAAAGDLL